MYRIYASEVAALVGKNPYKKQNEAIQDMVNRNTKGLPPLEILRASNAEILEASNLLAAPASLRRMRGAPSAS